MYLLENTVRKYAWGSRTAMARLFGRPASGEPEAELWIGAHPASPSTVLLANGPVTLDAVVAADPDRTLGSPVSATFGGQLPFLMKVLAAGEPLSLQVHPTLAQAGAGFAAEEQAGVPLDAPHRNYRDANHKPEMIFALTQFSALSGFRDPQEAAVLFRRLHTLLRAAGSDTALTEQILTALELPDAPAAVRGAFTALLEGGGASATLVDNAAAVLAKRPEEEHIPEFSAAARLIELHPQDPGTLVSLLLNLVSLQPGQALCLPAGNVHSYLEGVGIEVMAASDNVLRGGLTAKRVDVPELLKVCDFRPIKPNLVTAGSTDAGQELYCPPFTEFQLQRIELHDGGGPVPLAQHGPALVLAVSGGARLDSPKSDLTLRRGDSAFIPDSEQPVLVHNVRGGTSPSVLFAVTTAGNPDEFAPSVASQHRTDAAQ